MGYYDTVYTKRLNRYGTDFQSRMQRQREENFDLQLKKSVFYTIFRIDGNSEIFEGELTPKSQDNTEVLQYLLTNVNLDMESGTIVWVPDKNGEDKPWLIYYLESRKASGYNRYIVIRLTHYLTWVGRDGETYGTWSYFYGQEDNMLKDELKSRSRSDVLYTENLKESFFIIPTNKHLCKDDYLEVTTKEIKEAYVVTGYDIQSTVGVEFVSVDPQYIRDNTAAPQKQDDDSDEDFFWLQGGVD